MKKTFTILIAAIAAIMLITQPMKVVGQTRLDKTTTFTAGSGTNGEYTAGATLNCSSGGWSWVTSAASNSFEARGVQYTVNSNITHTETGATITQVDVVASSNDGDSGNTLAVYVGNTQIGSTQTVGKNTDKTFTFNAPTGGKTGEIKLTVSRSKKSVYIKSIKVYYSSGPSITASNVTIKASDTSGEISYSVSNPVTGGEMTAAEKTAISWIDEVAVDAEHSKVTFTATENTTGAERSGIITLTYSNDSKTTVTKDVTVTQKRYYTATFHGNGGTTPAPASLGTYTQNVSDGLTAPLTANQFVNGLKAFKHWNTDKDDSALGTEYADEADYTFSSDITLYAIWAESYSVTYKANDGTGDEIVNNYAEGNDVPIAANTFTAPEGQMFVKWYTHSTDDGDGTAYQPGDEIENIGANYTLYAIWADKCTLTLNSNGMTTTFDVPQGYEYNFPTPSNMPEGYVYKGWSTNSSAAAEGSYSFTPATSAVSYYAVFGVISYGDFSLVEEAPEAPNDWSGRYLIVYNNTNVLDGPNGNHDENTYGTYVNISSSYSNKVITKNNTTSSHVITVTATTNGYSLYDNGNEAYLGCKDDNNTGLRWDGSFNAKQNEWTLGVGSVVSVKQTGRAIRWNDNSGSYRFSTYTTTGQQAIQLFKQAESISSYTTTIASPTISGDVEITTPTTISSSQTFSGDLDITETLTIGATAVVTVEGDITNSTASNLIIEDGGQLILPDNATVAATMKKTTSASTEETKDAAVNKWYAISTPVSGVAISSFIPTTEGAKWNVYRYDEPTGYWNEYRSDNTVEPYLEPFTTLENGRGYLYRSTTANLEFAGNVNAGDKDGEVKYDLSYAYAGSNDDFKGFNLLGNPFTHNITWSNLVTTNVENDGYYLLIEEEGVNQGKWSANPLKTAIAPMQAFLVQANNTGAKVTIKNHASLKGEMKGYNNDIMFAVKNGEQSDEAYVLFKDGKGLNKVNHRNAEIPMLYVVNNGEKFAIADMNTDTKVINLGFEAKYIAKYTLSLKANGNFSYLHLIDKLTGEDVDMLLEDEYSFMASPTDNAERFIVRLEYSEGSESSEVFAYQNGSDIIVSGEGELQVFDVMGRLVMQKNINGVERINAEAQGVYIFKLNEKTQKIVVR